MKTRFALAALALSFAVGACNQDTPTTPPDGQQPGTELKKDKDRAQLLRDLAFGTSPLFEVGSAVSNGQTTSGKVTITGFAYDQATQTLRASGSITYVNPNNGQEVTQPFVNAPATLTESGAPTSPVCQILNLDIGRIFLNLLGLEVDIAPISIDIRGRTGPGNLLGNLLCALAGLLDPPGPLAAILQLIDRINAILAGL